MKKIMFNDRFGLTQAVLDRRKTMTRRIVRLCENNLNFLQVSDNGEYLFCSPTVLDGVFPFYHIGEEVAVAQRYSELAKTDDYFNCEEAKRHAGWNNKMFVNPKLMPNRLRITGIKCERLSEISDEDCLREGIMQVQWKQWLEQDINDFSPQKFRTLDLFTLPLYWDECAADIIEDEKAWMANSPKTAFAVLIQKMMGRETWKRNPWVFAYEFELITRY